MSFGWSAGDIFTCTKLAWDLYHNCYLVARAAPDEFRQLVNELASLQGVLRALRDDVNSDISFLEKLGEARKQTLSRCIAGCYDTLQKLQELVIKYRQLGIDDGLQFWRKIRWVTQQKDVSRLRSKIMVHTCNLSLCMSSIGNSSLLRLEASMLSALDRQLKAQEQGDEELSSPLSKERTTDSNEASTGYPMEGINRQFTGSTMVADRIVPSPDSTPSLGSEEAFDNVCNDRSTTLILGRTRRPSQLRSDVKPLTASPRASEEGIDAKSKRSSSAMIPTAPEELSTKEPTPNVGEAVAEAMRALKQVRKLEQSNRPLPIKPQDPLHKPSEELKKQFQEFADNELKLRKLNARDWLRLATWWLLKARNTMDLHERPTSKTAYQSLTSSTEYSVPSTQAYVDLLKASWILYDIILDNDDQTALLTNENRKLFIDLSDAMHEDFFHFKEVDIPDSKALTRHSLDIWAIVPSVEDTFDDNVLPGLENGRWTTVELEDAGEEGEHVLYRTFVNAGVGPRSVRTKSRGAPYMLLLSIKAGESEPKVTLCNQSGTLALTRDFTPEDLAHFEESMGPTSPGSPATGMTLGMRSGALQPIPLNFGQMEVSITLTIDTDLKDFMAIPKAYFAAVKRREPRQVPNATESITYKSSVELYEILEPSTMRSANPPRSWSSCSLRILETVGTVGWRTTRRIVLSSSAGERIPWCASTFLPLSRVQIRTEDESRQVTMKWSDCTHERRTTDGNYNPVFSYVYNDGNPNNGINLQFRTRSDALSFEKTVLRLSLPPALEWLDGPDERVVYDVCDTDPDPMHYKALVICQTHLSWKYADLFYMYRDTDYEYSGEKGLVRFPQVYYTDYISNYVDQFKAPDSPPCFSYCEKKLGHVSIDFETEAMSQKFMSSLTLSHELIYSRRICWLSTKPAPRFGSQRSSKGSAEVQLWRKGQNIRLASRWEDKVEDKWITLAVPRGASGRGGNNSNKVTLPKVEFERGRLIDLANIVARSPRNTAKGKEEGPITVAFQSFRDQEEFVELLEGTVPGRRSTGFDELCKGSI